MFKFSHIFNIISIVLNYYNKNYDYKSFKIDAVHMERFFDDKHGLFHLYSFPLFLIHIKR